MRVFEDGGICVSAGEKLYIDANGLKGENVIITHAHSDHSRVSAGNIYLMTPETESLIGGKIPKGAVVRKLSMGKKISLGGFGVSLHNSGHILGSAQVMVENGNSIAVTSDFKLQRSILFEPAEILRPDILVIESTFGVPQYKFPAREKVYEDIIRWVSRVLSKRHLVVLGGYSTGKAQELTKIINEFCCEMPFVFQKIFEQNRIYEGLGIKLGDYRPLDGGLQDANVIIMPPHLITGLFVDALSLQCGRKVEVAIATGWGGKNCRYKTFPLSDHADFSQLMHYVRESNPKLVLTHHGYSREFAHAVRRKLGIPARPLEEAGQRTIAEFGF